MNTIETTVTTAGKGFQATSAKHAFLKSAVQVLLPVLSRVIQLSFPGMLNGQVLTPELIAVFIKSIFHSGN